VAVGVRYPLRQAVKLGVVPVNLAVFKDSINPPQRLVAAPGVDVLNVVVRLPVALLARQL